MTTFSGEPNGDNDWQATRLNGLRVLHPLRCVRTDEIEADFDNVAVTICTGSELRERIRLGDSPYDARTSAERYIPQACLGANHCLYVSARRGGGKVISLCGEAKGAYNQVVLPNQLEF